MLHSIAPARHLRRRAVQHQTRPEWTLESDLQCDQRIQEISARIGRVTGGIGIAANLRKNYPKPLLYAVLFVVSVANVFNLGADIGAMGSATQLVLRGNAGLFIAIFGIGSLAAVLLVPYSTYAKYLKWLTISFFACVGVVFFAHISWPAVPSCHVAAAC